MIDEANNPSNPQHVRDNYIRSLENIKERLDTAITQYHRKNKSIKIR